MASKLFSRYKAYENFDDFAERNGIEILSFTDGVAARHKVSRTYKKSISRITETKVEQVVGKDYNELSVILINYMKGYISLKEVIGRFIGAFIWLAVAITFTISSDPSGNTEMAFIVLLYIFALATIAAFIDTLILYKISRSFFSTNPVIVKDRVVYLPLTGYSKSLFFDVFVEMHESEKEKKEE